MIPHKIPLNEQACNNVFQFYYHNIPTFNHFHFLYGQLEYRKEEQKTWASCQEKKRLLKNKGGIIEVIGCLIFLKSWKNLYQYPVNLGFI